MKQSTLVISLSILLLVVIAASGTVLFMLPDADQEQAGGQEQSGVAEQTVVSGDVFNTAVLNRSGYTQLNTGLVQNNRLPVQPPSPVGKANPFL